MKKSVQEHKFTSTGIKFWRHPDQMGAYQMGLGDTIISTHVAPEGSCNLSCPYCSVKKRVKGFRIELSVIKDYIEKLMTRGLKAVILTGGGEPTLYPKINELLCWLKDKGLKVAMITNGTMTDRVEVWDMFSWVRVSITFFDDWQQRITLPTDKLPDDCMIGGSLVYDQGYDLSQLKSVGVVADKIGAKYIRVLPNCLYVHQELMDWHEKIDKILDQLQDKRFFHQHKVHHAPSCATCHQSYFRPYLSEVNGGTVYPCDSLVLNDQVAHFSKKYQLCKAEDVLDYLDGKIHGDFDPRVDCPGCVFTDNIEMLDDWVTQGIEHFDEYSEPLMHEEFV